jgi:hypothetical protein
LLVPLLSLSDTVANDIELAQLASPFPLRLLRGLAVFMPPILHPVRDDFLDVAHHDVLELG